MPKSYDLHFVSSNKNKFAEARQILGSFGIDLGWIKDTLQEIQSNSLKEISSLKSIQAYQKFKKPVIVEDDGLFIESLGGFPGPYSSFVFETIGNEGILKLTKKNRKAKFVSVISYCDKSIQKSLEAKVSGTISKLQTGKGWGYDPIFIPKNYKDPFAKLENKNKISHRFKALKIFSSWFLNIQESISR